MDNEKIAEITSEIEAKFRELADIADEPYITAVLIGGTFMMWCESDIDGKKKIDIFNKL